MQCSQLATVKQRVQVGVPLPFNVRDVDQTLLLARGHILETAEQREALFNRGALVDVLELLSPADLIKHAPDAALPGLWRDQLGKVRDVITNSANPGFTDALAEATPVVMALVERDKNLAILQVMRQEGNALVEYGVNHCTHAAITAQLVALRLGWSDSDIQTTFKATMTMNLAMLELQGQLAFQRSPLTDSQRQAIHAHPERTVRMLEQAGVDDGEWLRAVAQHHERADGLGYPYGMREPSDMAELIRRADIYTTKLSPRAGRDAMAADAAGRAMFMQDPGHPMIAAMVKEFGLYPPGCFVRLATGEFGVVIRRGPTVTTPVVAALASDHGNMLSQARRRDTALPQFAIVGIVAGTQAMRKVPAEHFMAATE